MALVLADRVKETSTTTGTGTLTLAGAATGFQSFSVIGNGNTCYYTITNQAVPAEWEVGIGTYTLSGTTLARTTILASSNAGSVVTLSAGTKDVFVTYPAGKSINQDASGNVGIGTTSPSALLHVSNAAAKIRIGLDASSQYLDISRDNATGFSIYNAAQTSFSAHIFQIVGTERFRIATDGAISLGAAPGAESLRVTPVASAVNYLELKGNIAGSAPQILAGGTDSGIGINLSTKGTGVYGFFTNSFAIQQFAITRTTASVNYLSVTGAATGVAPVMSAVGSDTNINLTLTPKGTGSTYSPTFAASNGMVLNNATINTSYTLPTGYNALSAGPVTIAAGVVVTVPSGSVWVVV